MIRDNAKRNQHNEENKRQRLYCLPGLRRGSFWQSHRGDRNPRWLQGSEERVSGSDRDPESSQRTESSRRLSPSTFRVG